MPRIVCVLSGSVGSGKSTLARRLGERYGAVHVSTAQLLVRRLGPQAVLERRALQEAGETLDRDTGGEWVASEARSLINELPQDAFVVVDAVRIGKQVAAFRNAYGRRVVHVHLTASIELLRKRYSRRSARRPAIRELRNYDEVLLNATEAGVDSLRDDADLLIDTERSTAEDVVVRVSSYLGVGNPHPVPLVDVIVGGEFGSEGKGNIAFYIAPEYDLLVRVGGPNAGHKVPYLQEGRAFTHRLLPSGTWASHAPILIGPGSVLDVDVLLKEIAACKIERERLTIDGQAMIISKGDVREETGLVNSIGSTGKGVGAATARRIRHRDRAVTLARDVPQLRPFIGSAAQVLENAYTRGHKILLEGTQGTGLSLYHGSYPHVTSRDTTVSGCLAEAGIAPRWLRRVMMVCRTYPIRVQSPSGSSSGPMSQPITWRQIAKRSGLSERALRKTELGSVSGKQRRVGEFDWVLLRKATLLNSPTDIALSFVDYLRAENGRARRFDQLHSETILFIEEIERVTGAPVTLISTGFHPRSVIDRREWRAMVRNGE